MQTGLTEYSTHASYESLECDLLEPARIVRANSMVAAMAGVLTPASIAIGSNSKRAIIT